MDVILITWEYCNRCKFIEPILDKYCKNNNYNLNVIDINEAPSNLIEGASMLPVIYFWDDRVEYDDALAKVMA